MANQKNDNNDNKNDMNQDAQRQRTGQQGQGQTKQPQRGAPTAGNRDDNTGGKMPPDRTGVGNDAQDVEVGDDRSPQRAPQRGAGKPDFGQ